MNAKQLNYFLRLKNVLSEDYRNQLVETLEIVAGNLSKAALNVYTVYVDVVVRQSSLPYSAFDIKNSNLKLSLHFSMFVGFIYSEYKEKNVHNAYRYCLAFKRAFKELSSQSGSSLQDIKLLSNRISDDVQSCIFQYQSQHIDRELLEYYSGWNCQCKDGKEIFLNIANVFDTFGSEFCEAIHFTISNYTRTLKTKTAQNVIYRFHILLNTFTELCNSYEVLNHALKAENSTKFMLNVYHILLSRNIQNGNDIKSFIGDWNHYYIPNFTSCFIDTGFFEEPITPFITPKFKSPKSSKQTVSIGGKFSAEEKERVFVDIPLEIKDEKALKIIENRLKLDLEHIRISFQNAVDAIIQRHERNIEYIKNGEVKPFPNKSKKPYPMGLKEHPCNTIATFYHHGYGGGGSTYTSFLGEQGNAPELIKELNIPTTDSLMAFASLLVIEHPQITPSWLQEWELFDKNGNQVGFKQAGKQWVAVSFKNRKGVALAQQEVLLSKYSKRIVEGLIAHTKFTRDALEKLGGDDWRYVMLTSNLTTPTRLENLNSSIVASKGFYSFLILDSVDEFGKPILTKEEAEQLAPLVTLRNIRKTRGLQIYIETHSIKAVADALGHKEPNLKTLSSYLPEPLMDYFNARWVRIFQNAIIFEALKDSPFLFNALDFDENKLNEFLDNHRLGELPEHLKKANDCLLIEESQQQIEQLDELVYTLSTPLFQVLIAIQTIVETAPKEEIFMSIIEKWYEAAVFILSPFSLTNNAITYRTYPLEAKHMYESAINSPLDLKLFKENLLCH